MQCGLSSLCPKSCPFFVDLLHDGCLSLKRGPIQLGQGSVLEVSLCLLLAGPAPLWGRREVWGPFCPYCPGHGRSGLFKGCLAETSALSGEMHQTAFGPPRPPSSLAWGHVVHHWSLLPLSFAAGIRPWCLKRNCPCWPGTGKEQSPPPQAQPSW